MPNAATNPDKPRVGEHDPQHFDPDESIGEILGRILTDSRELAEAEIGLLKAKTFSDARSYKTPAILLAAAFMVATGGVIALVWGVAAAIATIVGPLAGGAIAAILALAIAAVLAMTAKSKLETIK